MRTLALFTLAVALLGAGCSEDQLVSDLSGDEGFRLFLPATIPDGFQLISYGQERSEGELVALDQVYFNEADGTFVSLCVTEDPDTVGCVFEGDPTKKVQRGSRPLVVAAMCGSEKCDDAILPEWLQRFGDEEPSVDEALQLLGQIRVDT